MIRHCVMSPEMWSSLADCIKGQVPLGINIRCLSRFACKNQLLTVKEHIVKHKTLRTLAEKGTCGGCKSAQNPKNDTSYCAMVTASALLRALTHPER